MALHLPILGFFADCHSDIAAGDDLESEQDIISGSRRCYRRESADAMGSKSRQTEITGFGSDGNGSRSSCNGV